jgi:signal transduction histidine kinase
MSFLGGFERRERSQRAPLAGIVASAGLSVRANTEAGDARRIYRYRMSWPRWLAIAIAVLTGGVIALGCVLLAVWPSSADTIRFATTVVIGLPSTVLGLVIAKRRPGNVVGAILTGVGLAPCLEAVLDEIGAIGSRWPAAEVVSRFAEGAWPLWYLPVALLALYFPEGRLLPGRRWRLVAIGLPAFLIAFDLLLAAGADFAAIPLLPIFLGLLVASAVSMVRRHRAAGDVLRAQVKWFALAGMFLPATLLLCWTSYLLLDTADLVIIGLLLTYLAVPTATTIAMLRHDLYDVDRALSGAVAYTMATAALLLVFTAVSFTSGLVIGQESVAVAAATTAVCAIALAPLRTRLQRRVDRRLYPARRAALAALEDLRQQIHSGQSNPEQLEGVLQAALKDPTVRVGYRPPGGEDLVDTEGNPLAPGRSAPVHVGGVEIGALIWERGSKELLRELAAAAALIVEVVRLRIEVATALKEVAASRGRLQHIGYQERKRLERDLHDGAQQRLVSLGMSLRLAQRHLDDGTVDVNGLLDQSVAELGTAVAELRQLAHGLRPSSLDDGLGPALTALTSGMPVPVDLDVHAPTLPDDVSTTAYYVASEAVANAAKYAKAERIALRVALEQDRLHVKVADDGVGGATARNGSGLAGLADRVAAAGGQLRVHSPVGLGTVIEAVLPCAS